MDLSNSVTVLSALAQETRLKVFRLLVEAGPEGLPATEIADRMDVRQNLMSSHLSILSNAGVTVSRRDGRRIYHAVDFDCVRGLFAFLAQDCCKGSPETCASLIEEMLPIENCDSDEPQGPPLI